MFRAHIRWVITAVILTLGSPAISAEGNATLNLKDADIRVLIDTVSAITGKNFIIDPRVKAKVTVVSSQPMEAEELYQVFLSILQVHGFAAVQTGDVTKIVPDVSAKQGPVPIVTRNNPGWGDQVVTRVVQVNNVPAAQLVPILRPLIPQQGQLAAYQPSNILLISDRAGNINRLVKIIQKIDRPDQSDIEIIALKNAPASQVARTLSTLQQKNAKGAPVLGQPVITADDRTNSILISGDKSSRLRLRGIIAHLDTPLESGGNTQVVFLKYAKADELAPILSGISKSKTKTNKPGVKKAAANSALAERPVDIQADVANNALVITGPPAAQEELRQVIAQLDIRRAQVLLEAIIAEVSEDLATELGLQWAVDGGTGDGNAPVGLSNFGDSSSSILSLATNPTSVGQGLTLGVANLVKGTTNFAVLLRALKGDAATNILSTPTLMTLDNVQAEIKVGKNVPFITGQYTNTGSTNGSTNPFQTIERKDIGLTLRVKPQINEGDAVKLEIEQESSSLAASSAGAADLITNTRSIKTSVMAIDGQVIILGGLVDDQFTDSQQKVPGLGDIPLLGNLFKYNTTKKSKQSLMVFIRPVILRDPALTNAYTQAKYSYLKARQLEANIADRGLIKDSAAVLPDLDALITQLPSVESGFIQQLPKLPTKGL
ncbi:MAG: type II secretion system secretin GspD [bacterium]